MVYFGLWKLVYINIFNITVIEKIIKKYYLILKIRKRCRLYKWRDPVALTANSFNYTRQCTKRGHI